MFVNISFILPIYNVSSYLTDAIESILKQSISKEIILVDDGSTDNSLNIALEYAKKYNFIYVLHSKNKGVGSARNLGLRIAHGEFIFLMDPDDTLDINIDLEKIYELANKYNVNIVKGQYYSYLNDNQTNIKYYPPVDKELSSNIIIDSSQCFFHNALKNKWVIPNSCFLIRHSLIKNNHIRYNENLVVGEDILFNIELFSQKGLIMEVENVFFNYRIRPYSSVTSGITERKLQSRLDFLEIIKQKRLENKNPELDFLLYNVLGLHTYYFMRELEVAPEDLKTKYSLFFNEDMRQLLKNFSFCEKY